MRLTIYRVLRSRGLTKFRCKIRPNLNAKAVKERREFEREWRGFDFKKARIQWSDECSVEIGSGAEKEWAFGYPDEKWDSD